MQAKAQIMSHDCGGVEKSAALNVPSGPAGGSALLPACHVFDLHGDAVCTIGKGT